MSEEGQAQKKRSMKKGNNEDVPPADCEGDANNENIDKDNMEGNKRSSPRRKYLREMGSAALEKTDKKGKNKEDDGSTEEAEAGDEAKSKPSKSDEIENISEPPAKRRKSVKSVQENVSSGENSQGKTSKSGNKKRVKRPAKRITPKKSKASKKKAKLEEDETEYEVEKIIKIRILKNGQKEFLIRWKGFPPEQDTWEPEVHLSCQELVDKYFKEHKEEMEAPAEEEKKNKKGKSKRRGSSKTSRSKKTKSVADAEGSAKGNAKKRKRSSKKSRRKGADYQGQHSHTGYEDLNEYEVERIVDVRRRVGGGREYLIKWRGYSSKFNSWESEKHMNCDEEIEKFFKSLVQNTNGRTRGVRGRKYSSIAVHNGARGRKLSVRLENLPKIYCGETH